MKPAFVIPLFFLATAAYAGSLEFTIANKTGVAVESVHVAPMGTSDWKADALPGGAVKSGAKASGAIAETGGACEFDLRIVFADKTEILEEAVNLCDKPNHVLKPF